MSKIYILQEVWNTSPIRLNTLGAVTKEENAIQFKELNPNLNIYMEAELDDPKLLDQIIKSAEIYKGPIDIPCSACSAGDTKMEHHNHNHVTLAERIK